MFDSVIGDDENPDASLPQVQPDTLSGEKDVQAVLEEETDEVIDLDAAAAAAIYVEPETVPSTPSHSEGDSLQALAGKWTCVATDGLDEFLKQAGLGAFQ